MQLLKFNVLMGICALFLVNSNMALGQYFDQTENVAKPPQRTQWNAFEYGSDPTFDGGPQNAPNSSDSVGADISGVSSGPTGLIPNLPGLATPEKETLDPKVPPNSQSSEKPLSTRSIKPNALTLSERTEWEKIENPFKSETSRSTTSTNNSTAGAEKALRDSDQPNLDSASLSRKTDFANNGELVDSGDLNNPVQQNTLEPSVTKHKFPVRFEPNTPFERPPTDLVKLLEVQSKISQLLPRLLPTVVAIEGGSGIIVSPQGHILSVSHVSKRANRTVLVKMADGRSIPAYTLGSNVNTDTGALKLAGNGPWPFVSIQEIPKVEKGDWCLALGYPLSFKRGSPAAIRVGRVLSVSKNRIVTDCPIMGGDSGGPLFDLDGRLIGISSKVKRDINQNLHVTIKSYHNDWQNLVSAIDIPKSSTSNRAYLGVIAESDFGRVRIKEVVKGSPAELAGLTPNDVILRFGERPIVKFDDVLSVLRNRKPGDKVIAQLNRYGTLMDVPIHLAGRSSAIVKQ